MRKPQSMSSLAPLRQIGQDAKLATVDIVEPEPSGSAVVTVDEQRAALDEWLASPGPSSTASR